MSDAPTVNSQEAGTAAAPRRGRGSRSLGDMIRSIVVVGAFVVLLVLIVPRPSAVNQPPVDVVGIAQGSRSAAPFVLDVPTGLPSDWRATSARLLNGTDNVQTWHVGYQTADAQYAALEQAKNATAAWLQTNTEQGDVTGSQQVAGRQWTQILHENRLQRTLELTDGDVTILVTGTASWADLGTMAASLKPLGS